MTSEERYHDDRSRFYYGRETWKDLFREEAQNKGGIYLPDPEEILQGMTDIRWLRQQGFGEEFIRAVMHYRSPRIDLVRRVVAARGPEEAYRLLREFMP